MSQEPAKTARRAPESGDSRKTQVIVGARIRELRKAKGLKLKDFATETGLSIGYLSQLERDIAAPSIRTLSVVAGALGVNVSWFFPDQSPGDDPENGMVVRADRRRSLRFESGIRDELLCPTLSGKLELLYCFFEPGASSGDELYSHEGEEAGYVVEGQLELTIESELYSLEEGDSFHFVSSRPHRYRNPGESRTVVIWAMTPPHY